MSTATTARSRSNSTSACNSRPPPSEAGIYAFEDVVRAVLAAAPDLTLDELQRPSARNNPSRKPGPITEAACWAHGRRKFFVLADVAKAPPEAVRRIDAIFAIERDIAGRAAESAWRGEPATSRRSLPNLKAGCAPNARLSRHAEVAKAMDYMLKRWPAFTRFLDDGRICITNNAAERALRGIALGRKAWLFAGSDRGGERAAAMYSLIVTAKLNRVDPQAWLSSALRRINDHPASRLHELLPWHRTPAAQTAAA